MQAGAVRAGAVPPPISRFGSADVNGYPREGFNAPLAQSVERFHGKEKVNGSIPLGGSVDGRRKRRLCLRGGVAQLVRAHDS